MRWLRTPLLHFVAGGALLFVATRVVRATSGNDPAPAAAVVITAADVAQMRSAYAIETGLEPTAADEAALVEDAIAEELLFREAVSRGLDRNDRAVRSWLVEQARILSDGANASEDQLYARALELGLDRQDLVVRRILVHKIRLLASHVGDDETRDDELRAYFESHADAYRLPERISLWHLFLRRASSGDDPAADAVQRLAALRTRQTAPQDAVRTGDSFALPSHLVAQSPPQLEKIFGARFARDVLASPERAWSGPFTSPYGVHLVWVERHDPGAMPPFADVRGRVLEGWREERRAERLSALLRELKQRFPLHVESAAWRAKSNA